MVIMFKKKTWESYLLLDYGLPEWNFDKQIDFFLKITKFDQFIDKNATEMEIIYQQIICA